MINNLERKKSQWPEAGKKIKREIYIIIYLYFCYLCKRFQFIGRTPLHTLSVNGEAKGGLLGEGGVTTQNRYPNL